MNTIELAADHVVFEVTGGSSRCDYHADDITVRDVFIHDCPAQGLLGADNDSGSLTLEFSEGHALRQRHAPERPARGLAVGDAVEAAITAMVQVPESLDGVEPRGLGRGPQSEEQADGDGGSEECSTANAPSTVTSFSSPSCARTRPAVEAHTKLRGC